MDANRTVLEGIGGVEGAAETCGPASESRNPADRRAVARTLSCDGLWAQWSPAPRALASSILRYHFSAGTEARRGRTV